MSYLLCVIFLSRKSYFLIIIIIVLLPNPKSNLSFLMLFCTNIVCFCFVFCFNVCCCLGKWFFISCFFSSLFIFFTFAVKSEMDGHALILTFVVLGKSLDCDLHNYVAHGF